MVSNLPPPWGVYTVRPEPPDGSVSSIMALLMAMLVKAEVYMVVEVPEIEQVLHSLSHCV